MFLRVVSCATLAALLCSCSNDGPGTGMPTDLPPAGDAGPGEAGAPDTGAGPSGPAPTGPSTVDAAMPTEDAGCGSVTVPAEVVEEIRPSNLLVLMDRSLSLGLTWQVASDAFVGAITPIADALTVGAIFFPSTPGVPFGTVDPITASTQIDFRAGPAFIDAWNTSWAGGVTTLILGTPTDAAAAEGDTALDQLERLNDDPTTVLLITDGDPKGRPADPDQRIEAYAGRWFNDRGIRTYVLGVNGLNGSPTVAGLDPVAMAGGTGSFIFPNDNALLAQELQGIVSEVVSRRLNDCNIALSPPPNAGEIFLTVIEAESGRLVQVPRQPEYWELTADGQGAALLGQFCEDAKNGVYSNVEFKFGCVDVPVL